MDFAFLILLTPKNSLINRNSLFAFRLSFIQHFLKSLNKITIAIRFLLWDHQVEGSEFSHPSFIGRLQMSAKPMIQERDRGTLLLFQELKISFYSLTYQELWRESVQDLYKLKMLLKLFWKRWVHTMKLELFLFLRKQMS